MDFLKSCWTNLQAVHQDAIQGQKSEWDDQEQRDELLLSLRQKKVLVQTAVLQKKVCVFGGFITADEHMKELGWQGEISLRDDTQVGWVLTNVRYAVHQRGRLEAAVMTRANNDPKIVMQNQQIFSMFLIAVEASLSMSLSSTCGAVRVGHLTWIVPTEGDYHLLSLRVQMTAQGTLALLPHATNTGLSTATETDGANIILAPSGTLATVAHSPPTTSNDDAPPLQARREARMRLSRRAKDDNWKSSAATKLQRSSLPHDDSWLRVNVRSSTSQDQVECLWPGPLCLEIPSRQQPPTLDGTSSVSWFDSRHPYTNPLSTAESWFLGHEERADLERKTRQAEKDKEAATNNPPEEAIPDHLSVTSPVYSRSLQDHINVNGIYPTPPDAVPPIICSDPSIPNVIVSDDMIDPLPGLPEDNHDQGNEDQMQDTRRSSNASDVDLDTQNYRKGSTDDLFGDVDEEMFGNPDVTDADFNFFDDPGADRSVPNISGPTEEIEDAVPEVMPKTESALEHPLPMSLETEESVPQESLKSAETQEQEIKAEHVAEAVASTPPLSPLKIKERLLPAAEEHKVPRLRRDSTFLPVVFKGDVNNFDAKYRNLGKFDSKLEKKPDNTNRSNSIALPEKPPKTRQFKSLSQRRGVADANFTPQVDDMSQEDSEFETSQDSDSDSMSSVQGSLRSMDIRKRKRGSADEGPTPRLLAESVMDSDVESVMSDATALADPGPVIDQLVTAKESQNRTTELHHRFLDNLAIWRTPSKTLSSSQDYNIWPVLDFTADDLVDIAQLTAEQSTFLGSSELENIPPPTVSSPIYSAAQDALRKVFEKAQDCDFARVGTFAAIHTEQAIAAAAKSQQRPMPRRPPGTTNAIITMPIPPVHIRRAGQGWELQPTAINFWDALGLEPAHGPKDVAAFALYPDTGVMSEAVFDFMQDIRLAYESRKLGKHFIGGETVEHEDGLMPYRSHGEASVVHILQGIQTACNTLGDLLHDAELEDTIIIYMINPFEDEAMIKYLCGCFQAMLIAYSSDREDPPPLILQIVPISRIACPTAMIVPDLTYLSSLASFIYDRVPLDTNDHNHSWPLNPSPSIHLATPQSRKVNFSLSDRIPKTLLEEAGILHVAYAVNADHSWLSAAWTDNTGNQSYKASYCLSNTDGRLILTEVRDTTLSLARNSPHRIFVARAGIMRDWEKRIWRERPSENWSIALLDVDVNPALQVCANPESNGGTAGPFMTPAATPQASTFTSPETGPQPCTPAEATPSTQQEILQAPAPPPPDPDAFLMDITDETYTLLLPFSCTKNTMLQRPLACSLLLKRGHGDGVANLPSLAVDLMDVMPPRIPEGQVSWLTQRAPETVLRETMLAFRGLGLLGRVRGVPGCEKGNVPWHLGVAICGADALQGFLE
ncbi:hypothetical protein E4T43_04192 [Aureobasidium subglaciale]|nr:hypothetical protein E4T43_04192 [Aureobasidium subglaciale]